MAKIWNADSPPPIIREVIGSVVEVADTVVKQVWWSFEEALAIPACADPQNLFTPCVDAITRASGLVYDKNFEAAVDKQRLSMYLLRILQFFTQRRQYIANIPPHFRCPHRDSDTLYHDTSREKRGIMELLPQESAWTLLDTLVVVASQESQGVDVFVRLCKAGLLSAVMNSGFVRAHYSLPAYAPDVVSHIRFPMRIIPTLSIVSPRALKTVTKSLRKLDEAQETLYPPDDEALSERWYRVRQQLAFLQQIFQKSRSSSDFFSTCMLVECPHQPSNSCAMKRCSGCQVARYCMGECQRADWPSHRFQCYLFQCCGSQRQDIGLAEIMYYAALEHDWFMSLEKTVLEKNVPEASDLRSELASQQNMSDPMVLTLCYSFSGPTGWKARKLSGLKPFLQEKCWKEVLPVLQESRQLCFLSLPMGTAERIILSPRIALGYLNHFDTWQMPDYSTMYTPAPTPISPHDPSVPTASL
ncbi:hypothetical protein HGRIS_013519 [Hohenbuehelia grisea]|uniref:MYND-type domain-containing protein n=1 Tax=Hohenbuehelia grisea TaxID=104357 RepID=A0ABR3IVR6_9AGAR